MHKLHKLHRKFRKKLKKGIIQEIKESELKQKLFHEHYCSDGMRVLQTGVSP